MKLDKQAQREMLLQLIAAVNLPGRPRWRTRWRTL
jgi:hypothetical protein